ncbi:MAG: hypothetical protein EXR71_05850 [Myxococcales bacterium]|nr:hypothetical protein [Myxococcales bacterium]
MLPSSLVRLLVRATVTPALMTGGMAVLLLGLGSLAQALLILSVAPGPALLLRLAAGVFGSVLPVALGVGVVAGVAGGMARLRDERALTALAAMGLAPWRLALFCGLIAVPGAAVQAGLTHFGEPWARALVRDARVEVATSIRPVGAHPVRVGGWWMAEVGESLAFTDGRIAGVAARWALSGRQGGVLAELHGVDLALAGGARLRAESLSLPLALDGRARVHIFERTTPDLLRQLRQSAALARDGYERWTLWKRSLLPLILPALAAAAAGFSQRWGEGRVVGALVLGTWVLFRLLDTQLQLVGLVGGAAVVLSGALGTVLWAWRR